MIILHNRRLCKYNQKMKQKELIRSRGWVGHYGKDHPKAKKVIQKDIDTGEIIAIWDTIQQASKFLHINKGNITKCCQNKRKTAGEFIFTYKYPELQKVFQYTTDYEYITSYDTIEQAARKNNIDTLQILNDCLGNISQGNTDQLNRKVKRYMWRFYRF